MRLLYIAHAGNIQKIRIRGIYAGQTCFCLFSIPAPPARVPSGVAMLFSPRPDAIPQRHKRQE